MTINTDYQFQEDTTLSTLLIIEPFKYTKSLLRSSFLLGHKIVVINRTFTMIKVKLHSDALILQIFRLFDWSRTLFQSFWHIITLNHCYVMRSPIWLPLEAFIIASLKELIEDVEEFEFLTAFAFKLFFYLLLSTCPTCYWH